MTIQRKRVAKRLASGLLAGALALGGLAISGGSVSAKTPDSPSTNRIQGADRYATAVALARSLKTTHGSIDGAVIVSGESPYDALSAAVLSSDSKPILLVKKDALPEVVSDFLADFVTDFKTSGTFYVVGGESAISDAVIDAAKAVATSASDLTPPTFTRISGEDRYATAAAVAARAGVMSASDKLIIANGESWADALSAAAMSSEKGWPIVTTPASGLNASAKATITSYLNLPASAAQFVIVGGPAVVPTSVEEYLVGEGVNPADIRRLQGADRYGTNLAVNVYMVENGIMAQAAVALISGEAPWDALASAPWAAKSAIHPVLTRSTSLSTGAQTLAAVVAAGDNPGSLYVVGGRSAVADSVRSAFIATTQSTNIASASISGCYIGSTEIKVTFSSKLSSTESTNFVAAGAPFFKVNTTALTGGMTLKAGAFDGTRVSYTKAVSALEAEDVVTFAGIPEGTSVNGTAFGRSVASATCSVPYDTTAPSITLQAATTSGSPLLIVKSSEPLQIGAMTGATTPVSWAGSGSTGLSGLAGSASVSATALNATSTAFSLSLTGGDSAFVNSPTATTSATGVLLTVAKGAFKDLAGNTALVDPTAKIAADVVAPTLAAAVSVCAHSAGASGAVGSLTISDAGFTGTAAMGASGNDYSIVVVNQRGLLLPTVSLADKVFTVTADTGYHTVNDVITAAQNAGLKGLLQTVNFSVTSGGAGTDLMTATLAPALFSGGKSTCNILLSASEVGTAAGKPTIQIAGNVVAAGDITVTGAGDGAVITIVNVTKLGATTLNFEATSNTWSDLSGNAKAFQVSTTLG